MRNIELNDATPLTYHAYRTRYPWQHGGRKILTVEYDSTSEIRALEQFLNDILGTRADNHYTITVHTESGVLLDLYFSDWKLMVFVMPDGDACKENK